MIVTDKHTYLFDVHPGSRAKATYSLTFRYPLEEAAKAQENANKKTVDSLLNQSDKEISDKRKFRLLSSFKRNRTSRSV